LFWIYTAFLLLACCYALVSILLFIGVSRQRKRSPNIPQDMDDLPFVSVLVAARNEENYISNCLESLVKQEYPSDRYEMVIVNDRSTDKTPDIIRGYKEKHEMIKCVDVNLNSSGLTGKQNALNEGLKLCAGEIILNTDADCIIEPLWIRRTVSRFTPEVGLSMGFSTTCRPDHATSRFADLFANLQTFDMLFLMDAAAGAIGMNVPTSGLGVNLAYRRIILNDIDYPRMGYTVTEDAALIRGIAKDTEWQIAAVYDKDAAVLTVAKETVREFLSQRIRWVIGARDLRLRSRIPLYIIFMFHLGLAILFLLMFFVPSFIAITLLSAFGKAVLDFARCWRVCKEFERTDLLKLFIFYEIFIVSYSIITGFGSMFIRHVRWKGEVCVRNARQTHGL